MRVFVKEGWECEDLIAVCSQGRMSRIKIGKEIGSKFGRRQKV